MVGVASGDGGASVSASPAKVSDAAPQRPQRDASSPIVPPQAGQVMSGKIYYGTIRPPRGARFFLTPRIGPRQSGLRSDE